MSMEGELTMPVHFRDQSLIQRSKGRRMSSEFILVILLHPLLRSRKVGNQIVCEHRYLGRYL